MSDTVNILNCLNEVKTIVPFVKTQLNTITGVELENTIGRPNFDKDNNVMINEESLKMKNKKGNLENQIGSDSDYFCNCFTSQKEKFTKESICYKEYENNKTKLWKELIEECININENNDKKSSFLMCTHSKRIQKFLLNNFTDNNYNNCFCLSIKFEKKSGFYVPVSRVIFSGFESDKECYYNKNTCEYPEESEVLPIKVIKNINTKMSGGNLVKYNPGDSFDIRKYIFNSYDTTRNQYYNVIDFTNITKDKYDTLKNDTEKIVINSIDSWDNTYKDYYVNINLSDGKPHRLLSREIIKVNRDLSDSPCNATDTNLFCDESKSKKLKTDEILIDIDQEFTIRRSKMVFDSTNKENFYLDILNQIEINEDQFKKINNTITNKNIKVILKRINGDMVEVIVPKFKQRLLLHYNLLNYVHEYDITTECFTKDGKLFTFQTPGPLYSPYLIETDKDISKLSNMTIYLIRHGDSLHNKSFKPKIFEKEKMMTKSLHRFRDSSLTPVGIAQAAYLGNILKSRVENTNTYIVSSYLNRAQHTGLQTMANIFRRNFRIKYPKLFNLLGLYNIMAINRIFYAYNKNPQKTYNIFRDYNSKELVNVTNKQAMRLFIINCLSFKQIDPNSEKSEQYFYYMNITKGGSKKTKKYKRNIKKLKTNRLR